MGMGGHRYAPGPLPPEMTHCPLCNRVGGPQGRFGRVRKISLPSSVRTPDLQTRSESLYHRLRPGPTSLYGFRDNSTSLETHTEHSGSNSCAPLFTDSKFSFLQSLLLMHPPPRPIGNGILMLKRVGRAELGRAISKTIGDAAVQFAGETSPLCSVHRNT